ncbi:unnamed protein product [Absidia cylindrospora]
MKWQLPVWIKTSRKKSEHVDQWFQFLSEAERTATIYTLLQHSSQVQVRFFINLLQQMGKRDSMHSILMTPNPEQADMQSQFAGALAKAEMEASQRLMSVLPYKTGQVVSRPPSNSTRRQMDRHSFALGDTEDYSRQFVGNSSGANNRFSETSRLGGPGGPGGGGSGNGRPSSQNFGGGNTLLTPGVNTFHGAGGSSGNRPRSVIEGDTSTLFSTPWTTPTTSAGPASSRRPMSVVGNIGDRNASGIGLERPKSADVSNWSFSGGMDSMIDQQRGGGSSGSGGSGNGTSAGTGVGGAFPSPWALGLDSDIDFSSLTLQPYRSGNGTRGSGGANASSTSSGTLRSSIPGTVSEKDEQQQQQQQQQQQRSLKTPTISRPTSPRPATSSSTPFHHRKHLVPPGMEKQFGQFLNPSSEHGLSGNNNTLDPHTTLTDHDYHSDHSETSNAHSTRRVSGANVHHQHRGSILSSSSTTAPTSGNTAISKEKKVGETVDLELLQDVPAWFRSLRLHKYNAIFEPMKWQDIVKLTDADLEAKGVAALGARRKMLKVFENIRAECDENVSLMKRS